MKDEHESVQDMNMKDEVFICDTMQLLTIPLLRDDNNMQTYKVLLDKAHLLRLTAFIWIIS